MDAFDQQQRKMTCLLGGLSPAVDCNMAQKRTFVPVLIELVKNLVVHISNSPSK